jgi:plasmid stabilization system protein ParE
VKLAWSNLARQELEHLRRYSIERWGVQVPQRYLEDVRDAAIAVAERPMRSRLLKGDLRIHRVRSHYLILAVDPEHQVVTIARVLHSAMDIERHLPKN